MKGYKGEARGEPINLNWKNNDTVEALLTNTVVSGQFYLQLPLQNCVSTPIKTLYFNIPISGQSLWAAADTFRAYQLDFKLP